MRDFKGGKRPGAYEHFGLPFDDHSPQEYDRAMAGLINGAHTVESATWIEYIHNNEPSAVIRLTFNDFANTQIALFLSELRQDTNKTEKVLIIRKLMQDPINPLTEDKYENVIKRTDVMKAKFNFSLKEVSENRVKPAKSINKRFIIKKEEPDPLPAPVKVPIEQKENQRKERKEGLQAPDEVISATPSPVPPVEDRLTIDESEEIEKSIKKGVPKNFSSLKRYKNTFFGSNINLDLKKEFQTPTTPAFLNDPDTSAKEKLKNEQIKILEAKNRKRGNSEINSTPAKIPRPSNEEIGAFLRREFAKVDEERRRLQQENQTKGKNQTKKEKIIVKKLKPVSIELLEPDDEIQILEPLVQPPEETHFEVEKKVLIRDKHTQISEDYIEFVQTTDYFDTMKTAEKEEEEKQKALLDHEMTLLPYQRKPHNINKYTAHGVPLTFKQARAITFEGLYKRHYRRANVPIWTPSLEEGKTWVQKRVEREERLIKQNNMVKPVVDGRITSEDLDKLRNSLWAKQLFNFSQWLGTLYVFISSRSSLSFENQLTLGSSIIPSNEQVIPRIVSAEVIDNGMEEKRVESFTIGTQTQSDKESCVPKMIGHTDAMDSSISDAPLTAAINLLRKYNINKNDVAVWLVDNFDAADLLMLIKGLSIESRKLDVLKVSGYPDYMVELSERLCENEIGVAIYWLNSEYARAILVKK